jgi:hypothetical protein
MTTPEEAWAAQNAAAQLEYDTTPELRHLLAAASASSHGTRRRRRVSATFHVIHDVTVKSP